MAHGTRRAGPSGSSSPRVTTPRTPWLTASARVGDAPPIGAIAPIQSRPTRSDLLDLQCRAGNAAVSAVVKDAGEPWGVVQRATANVSYGVGGRRPTVINGPSVGKGSVGGVSHSEQRVWEMCEETILKLLRSGQHVDVTFDVDTLVCENCQPWFETTVYRALAKAAQAGSTTFTLTANVMGTALAINGEQTLWSPEVAEKATFDRLPPMERSMKLLNEGRDEKGVRQQQNNPYASEQLKILKSYMDDYEHFGLTLDAIQQRKDEAAARVARAQAGRYDETEADKTLLGYMGDVTFSEMLRSGGLSMPARPAEYSEGAVKLWLDALQQALQGWLERAVEDEFEAYENQSAY